MSTPTRIAIVGLGQQGTGIAALAVRHGFDLVGAVDIGAKVGTAVRDHVADAAADALVHDSIAALLASTAVDAVILAATVSRAQTLDLAREAMTAGVSVLTLHSDLFEPDPSWARDLDRLGRSTGAGFLSTGVQDAWWVHTPALAVASTVAPRRVHVVHTVDVNGLSAQVGREIGIGLSREEFAARDDDAGELPIIGAALREAARLIGTEPIAGTVRYEPVIAEVETLWASAGAVLSPGRVIGVTEICHTETSAGIDFDSELVTVILRPGAVASDVLTVDATPPLRLVHSPFPGTQITNVAIVARIADVLRAGGGVHSAASLPAPRALL